MGAALEQLVNGEWKPLAFRSEKLSESKRKYSAFDLELAAIYFALKHFYYDLVGREFKIFTDHKPITFALNKSHDKDPEIRKRRLDFISEFNTSIHTISSECNVVAVTLSKIDAINTDDDTEYVNRHVSVNTIHMPAHFTLEKFSEEQSRDEQLKNILQDPDY